MKTKHRPGTYILVHSKYRLQEIDAIGQAIFMWLCDHADSRGLCFPSIGRIAKLCRKSGNTVKNRLVKLESLGLIKKHVRKNTNGENQSNLYQVIEDNWMPKEKGGSRNDLPISMSNRHTDQYLATNQTQYEQKHNNSSFQKVSLISYLKNIPQEDIFYFTKKYSVSRIFIEKKAGDVIDYCSSHNKNYQNYKYALQGFIEKDLKKNGTPLTEKRSGEMKQIGDILSVRKIRDP